MMSDHLGKQFMSNDPVEPDRSGLRKVKVGSTSIGGGKHEGMYGSKQPVVGGQVQPDYVGKRRK